MEEKLFKTFKKIALLGLLLVAAFGYFRPAQAATQYFSPSGGSYSQNATFSVGVYVSSADQSASAFSGYISFPPDKLNVTSVSSAGSIVSIWVQEPTYSNSSGTISFEGFIPNPGFTGSGGKLLTINFQVKGSGTAALAYSSGLVLANDGLGTNITTGLASASFTLGGEAPTPAPEPAKPTVPSAPQITSSTHPNPGVWSVQNDTRFNVSIPSGITGVSVAFDQNTNTTPGTISDGLGSAYTYNNVNDGTWYFHARLQNAQGWGAASHFPIRIDTLAPTELSLTQVDPEVITDKPHLRIVANDTGSGISKYVVSIDGVEIMTVAAEEVTETSVIVLPAQVAGVHTVTVTAIDNAGNSIVKQLDITFAEASEPSVSEPAPAPELVRAADGFLKLVKIAILVIFLALIVSAVVYAVVALLHHSHRAVRRAVTERARPGEARLRRALRGLRHDIHRNLYRLERVRRTRNLSEKAERSIRSTNKALDDLEDKITHTLQDI